MDGWFGCGSKPGPRLTTEYEQKRLSFQINRCLGQGLWVLTHRHLGMVLTETASFFVSRCWRPRSGESHLQWLPEPLSLNKKVRQTVQVIFSGVPPISKTGFAGYPRTSWVGFQLQLRIPNLGSWKITGALFRLLGEPRAKRKRRSLPRANQGTILRNGWFSAMKCVFCWRVLFLRTDGALRKWLNAWSARNWACLCTLGCSFFQLPRSNNGQFQGVIEAQRLKHSSHEMKRFMEEILNYSCRYLQEKQSTHVQK